MVLPVRIGWLIATATLLVLGACSSDGDEVVRGAGSSPSSEVSAPSKAAASSDALGDDAQAHTISAQVIDTDFRPKTLTVAAGTSVRWKQTGDQPHSVSDAGGSFDSSPKCGPLESDECLGEGDVFEYTFSDPGEYLYYCRVHGLPSGEGMTGTVVVE